jgi:hypothetical protein
MSKISRTRFPRRRQDAVQMKLPWLPDEIKKQLPSIETLEEGLFRDNDVSIEIPTKLPPRFI